MRLKDLKGRLVIELTGALPESVLNACAMNAIALSNMQCIDACTIRFEAAERDMEQIEAIARKCMCDVKIISHQGGSLYKRTLIRRRALAIFLLLALLLLIFSTLFIWEIEIEGAESLTRGQVLRALSDCGVYEGCYWPGLSSDMVRSRMIEKLPQIAWMSVNVSGSKARVIISERLEKPKIYDETKQVNIHALKTGIIRKMYVLNGQPTVSPGQSVLEGDMLISGFPQSLSGEYRAVAAKGQVWADTWYELSAAAPELPQKSRRGLSWGRLAIKFGKSRINFYISSGKGVDECDKIISEYKIGIEGLFTLPVSIVWEQLYPYELSGVYETDRELIRQGLYDRLTSSISGGEIRSCAFSEADTQGLSTVTLRAQCYENIAIEEETGGAVPHAGEGQDT